MSDPQPTTTHVKWKENSGGKITGKTAEVSSFIACHVKENLIKFKIRNSICVTLQFTAVCFLQNGFIRLTSDPKN